MKNKIITSIHAKFVNANIKLLIICVLTGLFFMQQQVDAQCPTTACFTVDEQAGTTGTINLRCAAANMSYFDNQVTQHGMSSICGCPIPNPPGDIVISINGCALASLTIPAPTGSGNLPVVYNCSPGVSYNITVNYYTPTCYYIMVITP